MAAPVSDFPCELRALRLGAEEFARGGAYDLPLPLTNVGQESVLHVRFVVDVPWVRIAPSEAALAAGERQPVSVRIDATAGRTSVQGGGVPVGQIDVTYQRLGGDGPGAAVTGTLYVRLPVALCPTCDKNLDPDLSDGITVPEVCPFCYERIRVCPVCGAANHWRARVCVADDEHILRSLPDWTSLGGDAGHAGIAVGKINALARRWSIPGVAPSRPEDALAWSAPVAAYGLVAAAAVASTGEAALFAFDARTGAPLWEPFPLPDPVYPERGGIALADGKLYAATVDGAVFCIDAVRGTRLWEVKVPGKVYGAVVAAGDDGPLLVAVSDENGGDSLIQLGLDDGETLCRTDLFGLPDTAPACADGVALVHDSSPRLTAIRLRTGETLWSAFAPSAFDAAPVVRGGRVFSGAEDGSLACYALADGAELWRCQVASGPITGTPAVDDSLVYVPASDGLYLVSAATGKPVRRYGARRPLRSAPVVLAGTVVVGGTDGEVHAAAPGKSLEKLYETGTVGSQIVAAPAVADGSLFLAATNGVLYALALT